MDIACPKCNATYRIDLELSDSPKGLKCAACEHVFGVRRAAGHEDAAPPPSPPQRRVTGAIDPELKRMASEEAQLRAEARKDATATTKPEPEKAAAPSEAAKKPASDQDDKNASAGKGDAEAPSKKDASTPAQPKGDSETPNAKAAAETSENKGKDDSEAGVDAFEMALGESIPLADEEKGDAAGGDTTAQTGGGRADTAPDSPATEARKRRGMGLFGKLFWSIVALGGVATGIDHFAPDLAEAWPASAEPLAAFQGDFAMAVEWLQARWAEAQQAVQDLLP